MAKYTAIIIFTILALLSLRDDVYAQADISISAQIVPDTVCDSIPVTFRITIKNNGPNTVATPMLLRLGIFDSTITVPHRTDTNIIVERVLAPGDSVVIDVSGFWTNLPDSVTYLYTDIAQVPPNDPVTTNNFVTKRTCYLCDCSGSNVWLTPPAIQYRSKLRMYPNDTAMLNHMRPGSTIAFYLYAFDSDYVKVTCTDIKGGMRETIYGPFADHVLYDWDKDQTAPGKLHVPENAIGESNAVLYQLPEDAAAFPELFDVAIHLKIGNSPNTPKAVDVTQFADISLGVRRVPDPQRPGKFEYIVAPDLDSIPQLIDPLAVNLINNGQCSPAISWLAGPQVLVRHIPEYLIPDTTCGAVGLAFAEAIDQDSLLMICSAPGCPPDEGSELQNDPIYYLWSPVQGNATMPLGMDGPVVPYVRPDNTFLSIFQCLIEDSRTEFTETGLFLSDTVPGCTMLPQESVPSEFERNIGLSIAPQPAQNVISIRFTLVKDVDMRIGIYDLTGKPLRTIPGGRKLKGLNEERISTSDLANGVYVLSLSNGKNSVNERFEIIR